MRTRFMTGAFLTYENHILFLQRSMSKKLAPGMWSCVGGHMEPDEISDPLASCYREIQEETGIQKAQIEHLQLRYITTRHTGEEIRTTFLFIGTLKDKCPLIDCDEGALHWITRQEALEKPMSFSIRQTINHWQQNPDSDAVWLCAPNRANDQATWVQL